MCEIVRGVFCFFKRQIWHREKAKSVARTWNFSNKQMFKTKLLIAIIMRGELCKTVRIIWSMLLQKSSTKSPGFDWDNVYYFICCCQKSKSFTIYYPVRAAKCVFDEVSSSSRLIKQQCHRTSGASHHPLTVALNDCVFHYLCTTLTPQAQRAFIHFTKTLITLISFIRWLCQFELFSHLIWLNLISA